MSFRRSSMEGMKRKKPGKCCLNSRGLATAWAYHVPSRTRRPLPEAPPIPQVVRILRSGALIDEWLIIFPLSSEQMRWLIDMSCRWSLLDDSAQNREWLYHIVATIELAFRRFLEHGPSEGG
jgi:hypothetical protein